MKLELLSLVAACGVLVSACSNAPAPDTGASTSTSGSATSSGSGGAGGASSTSTSGTGGGYPAAVPDQATTYQTNPLHTGDQPGDALAPPLTQRWTLDLHGFVSYPLIAEGRVFVTVANTDAQMVPQPGSRLYALDQATGKALWAPAELGGKGSSFAAYDNGRVFTVNTEGVVQAFDAATGKGAWSLDLEGKDPFTAPPVATMGNVYVVGGGYVWVMGQAAGEMRWRNGTPGGFYNAAIVSEAGVFTAVPGPGCVQSFNLLTGKKLWSLNDCHAGEGRTPALFDGVLYLRNPPDELTPNVLVDVAAKEVTGTFEADVIPAFHDKRGFFLSKGTLTAKDLPAQTAVWSFTGDGKLVSAPIVANGNVYVGASTGMLYALDAITGNMVWSTDVGNPIFQPYESMSSPTIAGLAVGGGALIVPAQQHLVAYW